MADSVTKDKLKIGVSGWRNYNNYQQFCDSMQDYLSKISELHVGDCRGTDGLARKWATENNISIEIYYADWKQFGRAAGPIRNQKIIDNIDLLIAFLSPSSKGTKNAIKLAENKGIETIVIDIE